MECREDDEVHDQGEDLEQPSDSPQPDEEVRKSIDDIPRLSIDSHSSETPPHVRVVEPTEESLPINEDIQSYEELHNLVENNSDKEITNQLSDNIQPVDECTQRHSDTDDTLSIYSEHSYCQSKETMRNDSGFVDTLEEEDQIEASIETLFSQVDDIVVNNKESLSIEEEYQRILHLLEESQKDMINEQAGKFYYTLEQHQLIFSFIRATNRSTKERTRSVRTSK